jgi:type IV fimbrial biogenesis protein FimT
MHTVSARARGFTLIELLVSLALAAILVAIAAPNLSGSIQSHKLKTTSNDLLMSLQLARSEALRLGRRVTVCASTDQRSCADQGPWTTGWVTFVDANANGTIDTNERITAIDKPSTAGPVIKGSAAVSRYVSFLASGRAASTDGRPQSGTLRICNPSSLLSDSTRSHDLEISATGRTTLAQSGSNVSDQCPAP